MYSIYCETGMGGDMRREFMAGHPELGFVYVSEHQNLGLVTANAKSIAANEDRRCIVRMREDEGYAPVAAFDGNGEIEDGDF